MAYGLTRDELVKKIEELEETAKLMPKDTPLFYCLECGLIDVDRHCWCDYESQNIEY